MLPVFGQGLDELKRQFEQHNSAVFQEKIFTHTDRDTYLAGELMWFKVYVSDVSTGKPSNLSKVVYVELLGDSGRAVIQTKVRIIGSSGNGSVFLPVSVSTGRYTLRAYTALMKNAGAQSFFEKPISVINSLADIPAASVGQNEYDIQFFPEGGTMLGDVENTIGFRATDSSGSGLEFEGTLYDDRDQAIERFRPLKFGLGRFSFTPEKNRRYYAVLNISGRSIKKYLPSVSIDGFSMQLSGPVSGSLQLKINGRGPGTGKIYYAISNSAKITGLGQGDLVGGTATLTLDPMLFSDGTSKITVFNADLLPVAERLYFKRPANISAFKISTADKLYDRRSRVDMAVETPGINAPEDHDLSVAVYRSSVPPAATIVDDHWLTSDLKGQVENPAYYLLPASPELAADNLMLTHGWRRFSWKGPTGNNRLQSQHIPEFEGHIITGTVTDKTTGKPAKGVMAFLSVPSKRTQLYSSRSDEQGHIRFFTRDMFGPGEIVAQTNYQQDSTYLIKINDPFYQAGIAANAVTKVSPGEIGNVIKAGHVGTQVQNIFYPEKLRTFRASITDSTAYYGKPEFSYRLNDFVRFKTTEEVLREYVPAVIVNRSRNNFNLVVDRKTNSGLMPTTPLIIFDGVPVFDRGNKVIAYDPEKIERLEVLTQTSFLGDTAFNSIINFTSFKGNLDAFELDPRDLVINYDGTQLEREFFSPVYETTEQRSSRMPDLRQLLYWSPSFGTDKRGKGNVSFYTSDEPGKYMIVVQGRSVDGQPGFAISEFEVK